MTRANIILKVKAKLDELTSSSAISHPADAYISDILDECVKEMLRGIPLHKVQPKTLDLTRLIHVPDANNMVKIRFLNWGTELASGKLTVGTIYIITSYTDANFVSDGAPNNAVGTIFKATGTNVTLDAGDKVKPHVDDFVRICKVRLYNWEREVALAINKDHMDYELQLNQFTRAGISKPVIVQSFDYYSSYVWMGVTYAETINNWLRVFECYTDSGSAYADLLDGFVDVVTGMTFQYIPAVVAELLADDLIEPLAYLCAAQILTYTGDGARAKTALEWYNTILNG